MKSKFLKTLLSCSMTSVCVLPLGVFSATSCADKKLSITFDRESQIVDEPHFSLNYVSTKSLPKNTKITVIDKNDYLEIDPLLTKLGGKKGTIFINIDDRSVHSDITITYKLRFEFGSEFYETNDLVVNYDFQESDQKDEINLLTPSLTNKQKWNYEYKFQFSGKPKSSVELNITGGVQHEYLELINDQIQISDEGGLYYLYVPIHLDLSIEDSFSAAFNLSLSFTNSFGIPQYNEFLDIGCNFEKGTDIYTLPNEAFEVDENGIITGFRDDAVDEVILRYRRIEFSNEIKGIAPEVFDRPTSSPNPFKNIVEIVFNPALQTIGGGAFGGCCGIEIIDLSKYGENLPDWFINYDSGNKIFRASAINHCGIVIEDWSDKTSFDYPYDILSRCINGIGLNTGWESREPFIPYHVKTITPSTIYDIEKNDNGEIVLSGINEQAVQENGEKYRIIRIPYGVDKIEMNPKEGYTDFQIFGTLPCTAQPYKDHLMSYPTRRLLLNCDLQEIKPNKHNNVGVFQETGLYKYIYLPQDLLALPNKCFYQSAKIKKEYIESWDEGIAFDFVQCQKLTTIGDEVFANNLFLLGGKYDYAFDLPTSITKMGKKILYGSNLHTIGIYNFDPTPDVNMGVITTENDGTFSGLPAGTAGEEVQHRIVIPAAGIDDDWKAVLEQWGLNDIIGEGEKWIIY